MRKFYSFLTATLFVINIQSATAQIDLQCNGRDRHSIYLVNTAGFYRIDSVDTSPTDPILLSANPFGNVNVADGIAISNNLDSAAGPQTMYYTNNNTPYHFWNGTGWTNTNHTSGANFAVNPGGAADHIYNIDGFNGTIYSYDGTGNGTALVTGLGSSLSIVYDVAADNQGNFYVYYTADAKIIVYSPTGFPVDSFTTTGFTTLGECGLAILGDRIYATSCNNNYGLYEGIKTGSNINFTMIKSLNDFYVDIAACPEAGNPLAILKNPEQPHFAAYPNPAHQYTNIKLFNTSAITITDYKGAYINSFETKGLNVLSIDVSKWQPGVYFITAVSENKLRSSGKIVVY